MNKKEVIEMSEKYSENEQYQDAYKAGFQAVCNIIRCKINTCDNGEYCVMKWKSRLMFHLWI